MQFNLINQLEYDIDYAKLKNKCSLYLWPLSGVKSLIMNSGTNVNYSIYFCTDDDQIDFDHLIIVIPKSTNPKVTYAKLIKSFPEDKLFEKDDNYIVKVKIRYDNHYEKIILPMLEGKYSEIDKDYKEQFKESSVKITPNKFEMIRNFAYGVLHKDEALRDAWGDYLNMIMPKDVELDSIPDLNKEVYKWMN